MSVGLSAFVQCGCYLAGLSEIFVCGRYRNGLGLPVYHCQLHVYMRSPEYAIQPALARAYALGAREEIRSTSHIDTCVVLMRNLRQTEGRHIVASVNGVLFQLHVYISLTGASQRH